MALLMLYCTSIVTYFHLKVDLQTQMGGYDLEFIQLFSISREQNWYGYVKQIGGYNIGFILFFGGLSQ